MKSSVRMIPFGLILVGKDDQIFLILKGCEFQW